MAQTEQDSRESTAVQDGRGPRAVRMSPQNVQTTAADAERTKSDGKGVVAIGVLTLVATVVIFIGLLTDQPWATFIWDFLEFLEMIRS